jgi:outer membrane protein assembly factor BamB
MSSVIENKLIESRAVEGFHRTAVRTAIIAGLFCLVVSGLLVHNFIMRTGPDEKRVADLDKLKVEVRNNPDDYQLIADFRHLDLRVRKDRIRRLDFSRRGGYLLLAGTVVFFGSVLWATSFRRKLAYPEKRGDIDEIQIQDAVLSRKAVIWSGVVIVAGCLLLGIATGPEFPLGAGHTKSAIELVETWTRFRGPGGSGVYDSDMEVPSSWNGVSGEGIIWKSEIPMAGHNSPVVWKNRVFISGADANDREVYCYNAISGRLLWRSPVPKVPKATDAEMEEIDDETSYAASTMVTDGEHVSAIFANGDVTCFDCNGNNLWTINLGVPDSTYGYVSSLEQYKNLILVQYDQSYADEGKSSIKAIDVSSGEIVWDVKRPVSASWTSPILVNAAGRDQIITCSDPCMISYDPNTGDEIWHAECLSGELASSPIYAGGLVFGIEPYAKLVAVRPDGIGNVTETHIAWSTDTGAPDISCPVSDGELIFLLTMDGTVSCFNVADGNSVWENDIEGDFYASPSIVNGKLYILSEQGVMYITEVSADYRLPSKCELGESCHASPAFADGRIYIRGEKNLYCIGSVSEK